MTLFSNATGTDASMMLENTNPVRKSTLSSLMFFSASCLPTSGLNWSSRTITSAGRPPSLPPFSFTASRKASRMSMPSAALGPESVLMKPILTLSAACAEGGSNPAAAQASASRYLVMKRSPDAAEKADHMCGATGSQAARVVADRGAAVKRDKEGGAAQDNLGLIYSRV